eukprot:TRINITY_DN12743_c0_g1_i1.p1 TRINITY_DN12743_c0_g1~~TRINITY_DN12743_c0_g1_i1.p1  ORF type:complete len:160 (-),score=33.88 TRINITY_DN12743_c0_g1_i1:194-673(-)
MSQILSDNMALLQSQPGSPKGDSVVPEKRSADSSGDMYINSKLPLAPEDELDIKRQKRLIRNRVSAQLSRLKKRARMDELEQQVSYLKAQNAELARQLESFAQQTRNSQAELATTADENVALKQHVQMLKDALSLMQFCNKNAEATTAASAAADGPKRQ